VTIDTVRASQAQHRTTEKERGLDAEEFGKLLQQSRDGNAEAVLAAVDLAGPGLLSRADADGWRLCV